MLEVRWVVSYVRTSPRVWHCMVYAAIIMHVGSTDVHEECLAPPCSRDGRAASSETVQIRSKIFTVLCIYSTSTQSRHFHPVTPHGMPLVLMSRGACLHA